MRATSQILTAETFGIINYEEGIKRIPAQSKQLMNMIKGRDIGQTPKNEAATTDLMESWNRGWDKAHRSYMKEKFGF